MEQIEFRDLDWVWQVIDTADFTTLFTCQVGLPDIGGYRETLMMKLSNQYYLFKMDGVVWMGKYGGEKTGIWSLYALMDDPEDSPY